MTDLETRLQIEADHIAYHGYGYLKNALDSHKTGKRIQIQLEIEEHYEHFKQFRKHRKGKKATGTYRMFSKFADEREWHGPVDLLYAGWTVSSANGAVISFILGDWSEWLTWREMNALDEGYEREQLQKLEMLFQEIDEEGKPVNVAKRKRVLKTELKGGPQSKRAARLGQDPGFVRWMVSRNGMKEGCTPADIAEWIRSKSEIKSRAELDHDPAALERFEERVIRPFLRWTGW